MEWQVTSTQNGVPVATKDGVIRDAFQMLALGAEKEGTLAKVSSTVSHGTAYGEVKCSSTVTISCPQDKDSINLASLLTFKAAVEFVNDGLSYIAPQLERLEVKL